MTATREWPGPSVIAPVVRDEVLTLGPEVQLVGIVSHPSGHASAARATRDRGSPAPGFLLLNAGVLHRVGPHRLHVTLARQLAAAGIPALRLDLGGIGDSIASSEATSFRDSAVADTRTAMTGLTRAVGVQRFVLFGVCAGADNSLATALADERVTGIVLVDPPTYPTRRGQVRHLAARVAKSGGPREVLRRGLRVIERRLRQAVARLGRTEDPPSGGRELPSVAAYRAQLTALVERGVHVLAVYSGIHGPRYNHADQLFELFPELRGRLEAAYFPGANHTFTERAAQAELLDRVTRWTATYYG